MDAKVILFIIDFKPYMKLLFQFVSYSTPTLIKKKILVFLHCEIFFVFQLTHETVSYLVSSTHPYISPIKFISQSASDKFGSVPIVNSQSEKWMFSG